MILFNTCVPICLFFLKYLFSIVTIVVSDNARPNYNALYN